MPRIWADTIDIHRRQVHDAIVDATAALIVEHGPMSVAMSAVAERAGIGRATLYKYFPDVESILLAWHARTFGDRLERLAALAASPSVTLDDVLAFVHAQRQHRHRHGADIVHTVAQAVAGSGEAMPDAVEQQIIDALATVMRQLVRRKEVRADIPPAELARWLFHALHAPDELSRDAIVGLLAASLAPPGSRGSRSRERVRREQSAVSRAARPSPAAPSGLDSATGPSGG